MISRQQLKLSQINWSLIALLLAVFLIRLNNLWHPHLAGFSDELCHAIVARNLTKHLWKPTLYEKPYLPYHISGWDSWYESHVWLHKPPYALWQIAISYLIFGINTFALRFPSLILSVLSVWLTYLIGKELYNKHVGLLAAFLHGINPFVLQLIHGYMFSDYVDTALLFWVELACYLLLKAINQGETHYYILSGVAQGMAYLSKSFLGLTAFGLAISIYILQRLRFFRSSEVQGVNFSHIACQFGVSLLVAIPWTAYSFFHYKEEFLYETLMVFAHLNTHVEGWGQGGWDEHLFHYIPTHYPHFYILVFATIILSLILTVKRRSFQETFTALWIFGIIVPLSLAATKVYNYTLQIIPAILIVFSSTIISCLKGLKNTPNSRKQEYRVIILIHTSAMLTLLLFSGDYLTFLQFKAVKNWLSQSGTLQILLPTLVRNHIDIGYQVFWFFLLILILYLFYLLGTISRFQLDLQAISVLRFFLLIPFLLSAYSQIDESMQITRRDRGVWLDRDRLKEIGQYAKEELEEDAVLFLESTSANSALDYLYLVFYSDRSAYRIWSIYPDAVVRYFRFSTGQQLESAIQLVEEKGGVPYLISTEAYSFPKTHQGSTEPRYNVYKLSSVLLKEGAPRRSPLLLSLSFNKNVNNETKDISGHNHNGTIRGAKQVPGKLGNALAFDGQDDYVYIPYQKSLHVANGLTVSTWIRMNHLSGYQPIIYAHEPYSLAVKDGFVNMSLLLAQGWNTIRSTTQIREREFYHIVATYKYGWDGCEMKLYINGQLQKASMELPEYSIPRGKPEGIINSRPSEITIGKRQDRGFFSGIIDELRVYSRSLSNEEIQQLYMKEVK